MSIDTLYRIMSGGWLVGHTVKTAFPNIKNMHEKQLIMMILQIVNHDDPDDPDNHEEVSRELESARKAQLSTRL